MTGDSARVGALCHRALIVEVNATPKPGLVDRRNNGAHTDMNRALFYASASALRGYFDEVTAQGAHTAGLPAPQALALLRPLGMEAERRMFEVTAGVNTHKGAIFTLGLIAAAAGRLRANGTPLHAQALCAQVAAYAAGISGQELGAAAASTKGERAFAAYGARGARGEAEQGLPAAGQVGLPAYRQALQMGHAQNDALLYALLRILATVQDTNILSRHDEAAALYAAAQANALLHCGAAIGTPAWHARLVRMDDDFIRRNISPGGCADLLAATWLLHQLSECYV